MLPRPGVVDDAQRRSLPAGPALEAVRGVDQTQVRCVGPVRAPPSSTNRSASTRWRSTACRGIAREIHTCRVPASATQAVRPSSGTQ